MELGQLAHSIAIDVLAIRNAVILVLVALALVLRLLVVLLLVITALIQQGRVAIVQDVL